MDGAPNRAVTRGYVYAFAECYGCRLVIGFNVDLVPSVWVDPVSWVPCDIAGTDPAEAVRVPLCAECVAKSNPWRVALGLPPISVPEGAYAPGE